MIPYWFPTREHYQHLFVGANDQAGSTTAGNWIPGVCIAPGLWAAESQSPYFIDIGRILLATHMRLIFYYTVNAHKRFNCYPQNDTAGGSTPCSKVLTSSGAPSLILIHPQHSVHCACLHHPHNGESHLLALSACSVLFHSRTLPPYPRVWSQRISRYGSTPLHRGVVWLSLALLSSPIQRIRNRFGLTFLESFSFSSPRSWTQQLA